MSYVELLVAAPESAEDAVAATLDASGALGGWSDGGGLFHGYFAATVEAPVSRFLESWKRVCGSSCPHPIETRTLAATDWDARWRASVAPIQAAPGLWIVPPSTEARSPGDIDVVVTIEPGLGFGTGTHPTTRALIGWLAAAPTPATVLDVGTGSGILALTALALGARVAVGLDIEREAISGAAGNRMRNTVGRRMHLVHGTIDSISREARFGAVVANLDARLFSRSLPAITQRCASRGRFGAAGLLESEKSEFLDMAHRQGLTLLEERRDPDPASGDIWWSGWFQRDPAT